MYCMHDIDGFAAWLAFGMFHVDSPSRVTTLRLRMHGTPETQMIITARTSLTRRFTDIFRRVLTRVVSSEDLAPLHSKTTVNSTKRKRDDPQLECPLDEVPLPSDKRVFVEVAAKTEARVQPSVRSTVVAMLSEDDDAVVEFQVIRRLRDWLAVVVPGAGAGWIPRKAVVKESTLATQVSQELSTNGRVRSCTWQGANSPTDHDLQQQQAGTIVGLLELIGTQLEVLQLPYHRLERKHVAPIVERCPSLKALNLSGNYIDDITPLVDAYEQGRCKVSSLSVAQLRHSQSAIIQQCIKILELCREQDGRNGAPKRPLMKQLVVRFTPVQGHVQNHIDTVGAPFGEAVKKSRHLEYAREYCSEPMWVFQRTRNQSSELESNESTRPLVLSSKLAMLSIVHHTAWRRSQPSALDAGVLSLIFSFARSRQPHVHEIVWDR